MGSDMSYLAAESGGSGAFNLILLLAIPVVFYLLLIRPQNKRRQQQLRMQSSVRPGVRVMTTSGMHATVVEVDDDGLLLEIAPDVEVRFVKQAIMNVLDEPGEPADADAPELDDVDEADAPAGDGVELRKDDAEGTGGTVEEKAGRADKP